MRHLTILRYIDDVGRSGSIRRTSERVNLTPSALTRQIQDFERELGVPVFERLPHGMRLNAAGELLVQYIRGQAADLERLKSRIADLSGVRRGHITIACSQAFTDHVLPLEIETYRRQFSAVSFLVQVRDHALGIAALAAFEADIAWLVQPPLNPDVEILLRGQQPLCALMARNHPLADSGALIRLRECFDYPVAMPDASLAIRHLLDAARIPVPRPANIQVESGSLEFLRNYVAREHVISFQVSAGIPLGRPDLHARPIDGRDIEPVAVVLGQQRGRRLSIAAAKFVDQLSKHPLWQ